MTMGTEIKLAGVTKDTWVRLIILIASLINMALNKLGITSFTSEDINAWYDIISVALTMGASLWCAWKNNSITSAAQAADEIMKSLKNAVNTSETIE